MSSDALNPCMSSRSNGTIALASNNDAGRGRSGVLVLVFLVEDTERRFQVTGRQCDQRTRQRRFRDRLVDLGVIRGIGRDVFHAVGRDRSEAERIEPAADGHTAVRCEGQLLDLRGQQVGGLAVDLVVGANLRVHLVFPVFEDLAGKTQGHLVYVVFSGPGTGPGFRHALLEGEGLGRASAATRAAARGRRERTDCPPA